MVQLERSFQVPVIEIEGERSEETVCWFCRHDIPRHDEATATRTQACTEKLTEWRLWKASRVRYRDEW